MLCEQLLQDYRVSVVRSCKVVMLHKSVWYYKRKRNRSDAALQMRMKELALSRVRYGFWRLFTLLRREGWKDNHKRVYRLYKLEGLNLRVKRNKRIRMQEHRYTRPVAEGINQLWSMDFVSDQLFDGKRFRSLTIVDNYSRKCLGIEVGQSLKGADVVRTLENIKAFTSILQRKFQG